MLEENREREREREWERVYLTPLEMQNLPINCLTFSVLRVNKGLIIWPSVSENLR